jgi:hypothetical protein
MCSEARQHRWEKDSSYVFRNPKHNLVYNPPVKSKVLDDATNLTLNYDAQQITLTQPSQYPPSNQQQPNSQLTQTQTNRQQYQAHSLQHQQNYQNQHNENYRPYTAPATYTDNYNLNTLNHENEQLPQHAHKRPCHGLSTFNYDCDEATQDYI